MATKKKALKKSKLCHAEYYDFQKIQDKLYAESMDGKMFTKLVEIITLPENIKLAYRNIKKNKGSKTAGTDGKTIQHLEKLSEEKLVVLVQRKFSWYVPQSVRRVEIPKDNGKTRPLGIPTIMDRLVQQCVLQVLEPICEAKFHDHSYGFRPNRSQQHAISQVHKNMQLSHLHYVVDIDIKGFFDNVSHGKLLKQLWTLGMCRNRGEADDWRYFLSPQSPTLQRRHRCIPKSDFVMRKCPQAYSRYRYRHYCKAYGFLKPHSETENQS